MKNSTKILILVWAYGLFFICLILLPSCSSTQNCCGGKKSYNNYKPNTHKTNFNKKKYHNI